MYFFTPPTEPEIKERVDKICARLSEITKERDHLIESLRFFNNICKHKFDKTNMSALYAEKT
jgi:hypothetical protein